MKSVLIPTLSVLGAIAVLAGAVVWVGATGGMTASSADSGDGYYISEFHRSAR